MADGGSVIIRGVDVDPETRCAHYDGPKDVVAIQFPCCEAFYPCSRCHEEVADHPAERWSRDAFDRRAVYCGACGHRLRILTYRGTDRCPACGTDFNPGCAAHADRYFAVEADADS
jgi:uncharacterized CHY-type Zn-finger protein